MATSFKKRQGSFRAASFFSFPEDDGDGDGDGDGDDDDDDDDDSYEGCFFSFPTSSVIIGSCPVLSVLRVVSECPRHPEIF